VVLPERLIGHAPVDWCGTVEIAPLEKVRGEYCSGEIKDDSTLTTSSSVQVIHSMKIWIKKTCAFGLILGLLSSILGSFIYSMYLILSPIYFGTFSLSSQIDPSLFLTSFLYCEIYSFLPCGISGVVIQKILGFQLSHKNKLIWASFIGSITGLYLFLFDNMLILNRIINYVSLQHLFVIVLIGAVLGGSVGKALNTTRWQP
jgi:hypothetical protein